VRFRGASGLPFAALNRLEPRRAHEQTARVIFESELETLPREGLRALQAERLRALVAYAKERVPLYRERLAEVDPPLRTARRGALD